MNPNLAVLDAFGPIAQRAASLDLSDPAAAEAALNLAFPAEALARLSALSAAAEAADQLTPRVASPAVRFGRLSKPSEALAGHSLDVVEMTGAGAAHTHPRGEISLCFAREGEPRFCGRPGPWVVVPPGAWHVPEVTGGRMVIYYLLPGGEIRFDG